jgi:hypothetical protein
MIKLHAQMFKKHGMTTIRNFDALNDVNNLIDSGKAIHEASLKHEVTVTMMSLPDGLRGAHDPDFYERILKEIIAAKIPFDSVCFKDASGTSTPSVVYETMKRARKLLGPNMKIVFHSHETAGVSVQQYMAALDGGASSLDLSMSPVSGGTCQPDIITMWHALRGTNYTLDIDIEALEKSISKKTKALMLVHLYGRCTYNEHINTFCKDNNLILIEDNAQAHGCIYSQNRKTGSLGNIGCHSFYPGKNLGALGDGGAITTNNDTLAETIRSIANYGFKEKYVAEYQGRNSRLDDIQAAVLDVKLSHLDEDNQRRQAIAHIYYKYIENPKVALPSQLADENNVYHIFPLFTAQRDALQQHLESRGIQTLIHYPIPPHKQTCYRQWNHIHMPVAEKLATQELSIPLHPAMTDEMAKYIIDAINAF